MNKFNKNYLDHNFILYTKFYDECDYKCEKCDVIVFHELSDNDYYIVNIVYPIDPDDEIESEADKLLKLTCEECIIKNILE
jgi:hypothetical protein